MAALTTETPVNQEDPATCRKLSTIIRENLLRYALKPTEFKFVQRLVLETYDRDRFVAPIQLEEWARGLEFRDARGLRVDKARAVFDTLRELLIVDANEGQGTYQLRPDISAWSNLRPGGPAGGQKQFKLCAERPLDEALSSVSREAALASGDGQSDPDVAALFAKLKELAAGKCSEGDVGEFWEEVRRKNPTRFGAENFAAAKSAQNQAIPDSSEKSDAVAIASSALSTQKAKLAKESEKSDAAGRALAWLERVDTKGQMQGKFREQWLDLCARDAAYVLRVLRGKLDYYNRRVAAGEMVPINDPIAWLSRSARDDRKFSRVQT